MTVKIYSTLYTPFDLILFIALVIYHGLCVFVVVNT
jgi:hypothetical protein